MSPFLGTHHNRLDPKFRVSIPAAFRATLKAADQTGLILRPSHRHPCIEAWSEPAFAALAARLNELELFSESHEALAEALYGGSCMVEPDKDGRVMLPDEMVEHAALSDSVAFIGLGKNFQIWEPAAGKAFREAARAKANLRGLTLPVAAA